MLLDDHLIKVVENLTNNKIDIKNATIYLAFKRMEKSGFISSYMSEDNINGGKRKYYKITDLGRNYLKDKKKEWKNNKKILDKLLLGD